MNANASKNFRVVKEALMRSRNAASSTLPEPGAFHERCRELDELAAGVGLVRIVGIDSLGPGKLVLIFVDVVFVGNEDHVFLQNLADQESVPADSLTELCVVCFALLIAQGITAGTNCILVQREWLGFE
jgi:hypothetical protein